MKELNLHEEILKSLKLISYDRSLSLGEQILDQNLLGGVKLAPKVDHQKIEDQYKKLYDKNYLNSYRLYLPNPKKVKEVIITLSKNKNLKNDGIITQETINTIGWLQKKYGLSVTGKIDEKTLNVLYKNYEKIEKEIKNKKAELETKFTQEIEKQQKELSKKCKTLLVSKSLKPSDITAKKVFMSIRDEVGEHWYNVSSWGTDEKKLLNALKLIKDNETYNKVLEFIDSCYPESAGMTIMEFLQSEEFSGGQVGLEKRAKNASKNPYTYIGPSLGAVGVISSEIPAMASWYLNDAHLKAYQQILQKFNKNETYYQENPYKDEIKGTWDKISKSWKTQMPPFAREVFHNATMLVALASVVFTGGLSGILVGAGIDIVDAAAYMAEGDPWMAGFCIMFALIPLAGEIGKPIKYFSQTYRELKVLANTSPSLAKKGATKFSDEMKKAVEWASRPRNLGRAYYRLLKMKLSRVIKNKDIVWYIRTLAKLKKAGLVSTNFLSNAGLLLGGSYLSWSTIAKMLGIEELGETTEMKDMELTALTSMILMQLDPNFTLSINGTEKNSLVLLLLQLILFQYGYTTMSKETESSYSFVNGILQINNSKDITEIQIFNITGKKVLQLKNDQKLNKIQTKKLSTKDVMFCIVTDVLGNKNKIKLINGINGTFTLNKQKSNVKPKWGYFDDLTKQMIENYQKKNNLSVTGTFNSELKNSLIGKINKKEIIRLRNITGKNIDVKQLVSFDPKIANEIFKKQNEFVINDLDKAIKNAMNKGEVPVEKLPKVMKILEY